ncbi:MAG: ferredoxin [Elusimicrobia bacterium]|nr:ferredoxin [Elusimicrobiota bacterium]
MGRIFSDGIKAAVSLIAIAGKTAPKAKGIDTLEIKVLNESEKKKLVKKMLAIAKGGFRPHTFERDANCVKKSDAVILVGSSDVSRGLDCEMCGWICSKRKGLCAYTPLDLGIAIGSMVSKAADFRLDNRIMFTAGYAALRGDFFSKKVKIAFGIPLSVTGKNIFFDRK